MGGACTLGQRLGWGRGAEENRDDAVLARFDLFFPLNFACSGNMAAANWRGALKFGRVYVLQVGVDDQEFGRRLAPQHQHDGVVRVEEAAPQKMLSRTCQSEMDASSTGPGASSGGMVVAL